MESDFNQTYPGRENAFIVKFPKVVPTLFKILGSKKDVYIQENLRKFHLQYKEPSEDDICLFTLRLLPVLLQSPLKNKGADRWKPSKIELQDGFILHVNVSSLNFMRILFDYISDMRG